MKAPYGQSLALLTDLYQLTMAYGYWREGLADREAVFHQLFRATPFGGGFAVAAGLATALDWLRGLRFGRDDLDYIAGVCARDSKPLFDDDFLEYLGELRFECSVEAVPEGTVVFAQEPLVRVRGPLLQAQLAETALLNIVNFQTLIATKAARVRLAAGDDPVLEFGLRRAHGIDGGLSASRAAYLGGCTATSNVLAGKIHGIPVRGTHAHSWVMAFESETAAFESFARAMSQNCVLLVDTYDTREGLRRAIAVANRLRDQGVTLDGIRLDSGDLVAFSIEARRELDQAGLPDTKVVASNDLDEYGIAELKRRGARVDTWGIGTRIAAAHGQPALGGVYKLGLLKDERGNWQSKMKRSDDPAKASTPGMLQVRRFVKGTRMSRDLIYDELRPPKGWPSSMSADPDGAGSVANSDRSEDLLKPVLASGRLVGSEDSLRAARERCREQLAALPDGLRELVPEETYPVVFEDGLLQERQRLAGLDRP